MAWKFNPFTKKQDWFELVTPPTDLWNDYIYLLYLTSQIHNWHYACSGSGSVTREYQYTRLMTGTTINSNVMIILGCETYPPLLSWSKKFKFKCGLRVDTITNQWFFWARGNCEPPGTAEHIGFKIVNNILYGTTADGVTEKTLNMGTIEEGEHLNLEVRWDGGTKAEFFRGGTKIGEITENLPFAGDALWILSHAELQNTAAENKWILLRYWEFWQER